MSAPARVPLHALHPYCTAKIADRAITIRSVGDVAEYGALIRLAKGEPRERDDSWVAEANARRIMPLPSRLPPRGARSALSSLRPYFGNVRNESDFAKLLASDHEPFIHTSITKGHDPESWQETLSPILTTKRSRSRIREAKAPSAPRRPRTRATSPAPIATRRTASRRRTARQAIAATSAPMAGNMVAFVRGTSARELLLALNEVRPADEAVFVPDLRGDDDDRQDNAIGFFAIDSDGTTIALHEGEWADDDANAGNLRELLAANPDLHVAVSLATGERYAIAELRTDWEGEIMLRRAEIAVAA